MLSVNACFPSTGFTAQFPCPQFFEPLFASHDTIRRFESIDGHPY
jgi:hypothetical protein